MMTKNADKKREQMMMFSMDDMVPQNHMLRLIDKAINWNFIYDLVEEKYCPDNGRPSMDPVMLIKIPFIQYLYGIKSMRQTIKEIEVNVAYRWFLGLDMSDPVPHFSTFGKNYTRRFKDTDLFEQIFSKILEKRGWNTARFLLILKKIKRKEVLKGVSFELHKGECLGIIGESGSGKSTLGKVILGLEKQDSGKILFEGSEFRKQWQSEMNVVFQDYTSSVNPKFKVYEIINETLLQSKLSGEDKRKKIIELLEQVGLNEDFYYSTRVSAEKYVVYVVYHNFDHDQPRVIYFMFNPERTRMITVDIDMYH